MNSRTLLFVTLILIVLIPFESVAKRGAGSLFRAGRGSHALNGIKNYDGNTLSAEELKMCLDLESRLGLFEKNLDEMDFVLKNKEKYMSSLKVNIQSLKNYLQSNQSTVYYTQQEVNNYNQKVDKLNHWVSIYNTELQNYRNLEVPFNKELSKYNSLFDQFQLDCENKFYYDDDLKAIKNGYK